jgi:type VI secretion system secreted protein Hcp
VPIDYFLKIDGIQGESRKPRHPGEIDIISFSFGLQSGTGHSQGGGPGKVAFQDLHLTASINKASPKLFLACASGQHVKSAVLTGERTNGRKLNKFLEIDLRDVLVSSYQASGHQGQEPPIDEVSLSFRAIKFTEIPSTPRGTAGQPATEGWDLAANRAI